MKNFVLTSESVTKGHPDKLCDQICDAVIDRTLGARSPSKIAAECAIANGVVFLSVDHSGSSGVDLAETARDVIAQSGYSNGALSAERCTVLTNTTVTPVTPDWPDNVRMTASRAITAFGYACRHTPELMPYGLWTAHRITRRLDHVRSAGLIDYLLPDGQAQVAVRFQERKPVRIEGVAVTTAVTPAAPASDEVLKDDLVRHVVEPAFAGAAVVPDPTVRIVTLRAAPSPMGGPANHAGLTGRKIGDDNYGGHVRQTATALSGKDPSRIDRVAVYAARHVAKCVVIAEAANECEVQLSYAVGERGPISFEVDTFGSGRQEDAVLSARLSEVFTLDVGALIERFDLWNIVARRNGRFFRDLAVYGHAGRTDLDAPWEDSAEAARI